MGEKQLYIGLMSGTSADSIDAVLVDLGSHKPEVLLTYSLELEDNIKEQINSLNISGADEIHRMSQLDRSLGLLFAQAVNELVCLSKSLKGIKDILAVGSHGQTIRHYPPGEIPNNDLGYSLQIGDPNTIAELTGITTVADFRRRDIALGGQGAPLVPRFHLEFFEKIGSVRAIINIGGISNVTLLPGDGIVSSVLGYDTGPGNGLMDKWIKTHLGDNYDESGAWASEGNVAEALLSSLMSAPYVIEPAPKSTGPELFNLYWLQKHLSKLPSYNPRDVQATLLEFTAQTIAQALHSHGFKIDEVYICGGGAHNTSLVKRLEGLLYPAPVASTSTLGIAPSWVEAVAFAWLAKQTIEGMPGNIPTVTGAKKASVLGAIYRR
jgi:anhydro-N-acetylmuramic acid kinase|tara:strand:+ start:3242 stop:4381 length:1140 start_codon:yes stop_codon:yes gene_type:complete